MIPLIGLRTITAGSGSCQTDRLAWIVMICATYCHIRRSRRSRVQCNGYITVNLIRRNSDGSYIAVNRPCIVGSGSSRIATDRYCRIGHRITSVCSKHSGIVTTANTGSRTATLGHIRQCRRHCNRRSSKRISC